MFAIKNFKKLYDKNVFIPGLKCYQFNLWWTNHIHVYYSLTLSIFISLHVAHKLQTVDEKMSFGSNSRRFFFSLPSYRIREINIKCFVVRIWESTFCYFREKEGNFSNSIISPNYQVNFKIKLVQLGPNFTKSLISVEI